MKRLALVLLVVVLHIALLCLGATQKLVNQSGATASGLTVTFSEAVRITSYDKSVFPNQSPSSGESESFTFNGGTLVAGGIFQVTWSLSSAKLRSSKWITSGSAIATSTASIPTTYEEIMAQIAHYPGPDEPLYVPAEGEAIWLTDLEGHGDIYDNDSIKINHAPWFDKSQITRVEVYRNGIKMRFLPEKLDVLANEQMKTFDGNAEENTPKSGHTDHCIWGYQYQIRLYAGSSAAAPWTLVAIISPPVQFHGEAYVEGGAIELDLAKKGVRESDLRAGYRRMREMGFEGVIFDVAFFMASDTSNDLFAQYTFNANMLQPYFRTMTDDEIRKVIRLVKGEGLKVEMRIQVWPTKEYPNHRRSYIKPGSWSTWFKNYTAICVEMATLAQEEGCDILTPLVELVETEKHTQEVRALLDAVGAVFAGEICVSQATHMVIPDLRPGASGWFTEQPLGLFWDWSTDSRSLVIGAEFWPGHQGLDSQADTRFSVMVQSLMAIYAPIVDYFRATYPGHRIRLSEMGSNEFDGSVLNGHFEMGNSPPDHLEFSDTYAALITTAEALGLDIGMFRIRPRWQPSWYTPGQSFLNGMPVMDLVDAMIP